MNECIHCDSNDDVMDLEFPSHDGPHCRFCRDECDICQQVFCKFDLHKDRYQQTGLILCDGCNDPAIIAAKRCADSGSHAHLKQYLKLRKRGA